MSSPEVPAPEGPRTSSRPAEALAAAEAALAHLAAEPAETRAPRAFRIVSWIATALAAVGLVVHTMFEKTRPQVDETSVILLLFILLVPFASRFKVLEIGGAKAEWKDDATAGLQRQLEVLKAQHAAIRAIYADMAALSQAGADSEVPWADAPSPVAAPPRAEAWARAEQPPGAEAWPEAEQPPGAEAWPEAEQPPQHRRERRVAPSQDHLGAPVEAEAGPPVGARVVRRILWVDDNPAGNSYEIEALERLFDIDLATSTQEVRERLLSQRYDAIISDVGPDEGHGMNHVAGRGLLDDVRRLHPSLPVVFYGAPRAIQLQGEALVRAGAADAVASHVELLQALRRVAEAAFTTAVGELAAPFVVPPADDAAAAAFDLVLELPGTGAVGLVLVPWLRRPKDSALRARLEQADRAATQRPVQEVWVVAQRDVFTQSQRSSAPAHVRLLAFEQLRERLDEELRTS